MRRRSEKYIIEGSKYAHWIGLYLSFHLNWVLGPSVHGRLQNLQTNEVTFAHAITPLISLFAYFHSSNASYARLIILSIIQALSVLSCFPSRLTTKPYGFHLASQTP